MSWRVADLVLHLGGEGELALERRRAQDPLALGQDAHELRVPVHLDELDRALPVVVGHRVAGLDLAAVRRGTLENSSSVIRSSKEDLPTERSLGMVRVP